MPITRQAYANLSTQVQAVAKFYAAQPKPGILSQTYNALLAKRYNFLIHPDSSVLEIGCGSGDLLAALNARQKTGVDLSEVQVQTGKGKFPDLDLLCGLAETDLPEGRTFDVIVLSDVLNQACDVEVLLRKLHEVSHENTRLIINIHNTLWRPLLTLGRFFGFARRQPPANWLSREDVINLCSLADWQVFKSFGNILLPLPLGFLANGINRWLAPLATWACLTIFLVARRSALPRREPGVVSVIVPARNEAGSIADILKRIPRLGNETEVIIVEGNSTDNTWDVIQGMPDKFAGGRIIKMQQSGKGKGNAVIEGFYRATGDIVSILDADLTVPPEDLPKFVEALASRKAEFANGVRLVYPMDKKAMQFANLCANKGFSFVFSWLLGTPLKDTLCGTKVLWREDYLKLHANRAFFGDFDPFGDFDLIFGADKLNLKILDIPIRYRERYYGETNIQRWKHGVILLGMVIFAARKLKFV
jgi:SAM-dependent methyltransferase